MSIEEAIARILICACLYVLMKDLQRYLNKRRRNR